MSKVPPSTAVVDPPEQLASGHHKPAANKENKLAPGKSRKSSKRSKSKKMMVTVPRTKLNVTTKSDSTSRLFPKGIEHMKRLQEIQEVTDETKENNDVKRDVISVTIPSAANSVLAENSDVTKIQTCRRNSDTALADASNTTKHVENITSILTRSDTEKSLLSTQSVRSDVTRSASISLPSVRKRRSSRAQVRPQSVAGWTKKEMELFLPRKSFFSIHDNSLSHAGYDIRSDEERKRPEWRKFLRMHTMDELYPPDPKSADDKPLVPQFGMKDDSDDDDEEFSLDNIVTALSGDGGTAAPTKRKWRSSSKKLIANDREEYKPLYEYLKHIHDNPEEYIQMSKFSPKNVDHRHPDYLVRLGRAFRRGQHGAVRNNIYLHAILGLKPRYVESSTAQRTARGDKGVAKKEGGESSSADQGPVADETEIQKLKRKAEDWMKPLSTQQFLKAREMALRDIGEEDANMTKWWMAFRTCNYLRIPKHITDT